MARFAFISDGVIAAAANNAGSVSAAKSAVKKFFDSISGSEDVIAALQRPAVIANLAGQMFVTNIELGSNTRLLAVDRRKSFISLPFDEALEFWRTQGGSEESLRRVLAAYRTNAEAGERLFNESLSRMAIEQIEQTINDGGTVSDFVAGMQSGAMSLNISPESSWYLANVFRTNVQTAYGAGRYEQITDPAVQAARPWVQYRTAGDNRVRDSHKALDGLIFESTSSEWQRIAPPNGYQCFPAGTEVQGLVNAALRTRYVGELCEILTEKGRRLSVTPNHPIATVDGFVAAGSLKQGSKLLGYVSPVKPDSIRAVDEDDEPIQIEKVFGALSELGSASRFVMGADDLHGDAGFTDGNVDIVRADDVLVCGCESTGGHDREDAVLVVSDSPRHVNETRNGSTNPLTQRLRGSRRCAPRGAALALDGSPVCLQARPLQHFRIGPAACLDASRSKDALDKFTRDAEFISDMLHRFSGQEHFDDPTFVNVAPNVSARRNVCEPEHSTNSRSGAPERLRNLRNTDSGFVEVDHVAVVNRVSFDGHVYDLQSPNGWIVAQGIVTSNCRCAVVSLDADDVADERARGNRLFTSDDQDALDAAPDDGFAGPPNRPIEA